MRTNLATLIEDFRRFDGEIAVVRYRGVRRHVATYGTIATLAARFAALLEDQQIGPGDRILLWGENGAEWIAAFYGCILRGVVVVPLDAYGSAEFAARVAEDVKPKLAVGDALLLRRLPAEPGGFNFPRIAWEEWERMLPARESTAVAGLGSETPLQILFTSGTTGDPKGIVHTHGNVLASVGPIERAAQRYLRYEKYVHPLRFLHTLPLSHVFGQTMGLWIPPIFRAEVHFESRLVAPRLIETIRRERISVLAAVPRIFGLIKTHLEITEPDLAEKLQAAKGIPAWKRWWRFRDIHREFGLKFWALISGGGSLPPAVEQFWNGLGFVVVQGYGMTETTALITLNHPFHVARGTIGKPLPGREVKLGPDGEVLVRGPMISTATWSGGELRQRSDDWLATGDLAETQATGELRFLGRKSEVIVTGTGVNIHPEDLEAEIEQQPGVTACAVVPVETPAGTEACAVLALHGDATQPSKLIEVANTRLAEFQRVRRWLLWPDPDLPRTSTGKVRRRVVGEWAAERLGKGPSVGAHVTGDWLLTTLAQITGERPEDVSDAARLNEDLHLDSLARVQLAAAIEEKLGMAPESGLLEQMATLGEVRRLIGGGAGISSSSRDREEEESLSTGVAKTTVEAERHSDQGQSKPGPARSLNVRQVPVPRFVYPHWPWLDPFRWVRNAFLEVAMRPLVHLLAKPRIVAPGTLSDAAAEPMLIVANHVTTYDGPLVLYALPGKMRRSTAAAMLGEMLEDYRHFRNPESGGRFAWWGPAAYVLVTWLFNVFPLPQQRDFQRSFAHAGEALDRGYNVMIFPEGTRSSGRLGSFRPGIGLLVKQANAAVLPVGIVGLGELKEQKRGWFRSGRIEVRVGEPVRFHSETTETEITSRLHAAVEKLLSGDLNA